MERVVGREGGVTGDKAEKRKKEREAEKGRGEIRQRGGRKAV